MLNEKIHEEIIGSDLPHIKTWNPQQLGQINFKALHSFRKKITVLLEVLIINNTIIDKTNIMGHKIDANMLSR